MIGLRIVEVASLLVVGALAYAGIAGDRGPTGLAPVVAAEQRPADLPTTATQSQEAAPEAERPTPPEAAPVEREADRDPNAGEHPIVWVKPGSRVVLRDSPGGDEVAEVGDETEFGSPTVFAVKRHTGRWIAAPSPELPNGELAWVRADPSRLYGGYVDYAIRVDLSERRAALLKGGDEVRSWEITVGDEARRRRRDRSPSRTRSGAASTPPTAVAPSPSPPPSRTSPPTGPAATGSPSTAPAGRWEGPSRSAASAAPTGTSAGSSTGSRWGPRC